MFLRNAQLEESFVFSYDWIMLSIRYFFTDPPIRTREFCVRGLGIQEQMPPVMVDRPKGTGDYLLMVFFNDVEFLARDGLKQRPAGTIILWRQGACHLYGSAKENWRHSWVHFSGTLLDQLIAHTQMPLDTAIQLSDPYVCDKYLLDLHIELGGRSAPDVRIATNIMENWLREIVRMKSGRAQTRLPEAVARARGYIESRYSESLCLESIASHARISVPHLCAQFKEHCGVSVMAYVIRLRMAKAQHLIQDTALPVGQVARAVGYEDLFYFSKLFKKHFGKPPREMRRMR